MQDVPDIKKAEELLFWAEEQNPGPWGKHSRTAARAAATIAAACGVDADRAYALGLLHDIGRFEGQTALRHVLAGYDLLMEAGYEKAAQVCLSHSFPFKNLAFYTGQVDCPAGECQRIELLLDCIPYDDEILLIQLCDAISLPDRVTVMECRLMEVALRHGIQPAVLRKWAAFLELKTYFDKKCGHSIYKLFQQEISASLFY